MGEGCGHLKEDMCIQMGHAAEYYIRTGRGRQITREEAFEIIKRAEENGLMHQIPNLDGSGKTHAICNCCGCSCLSLRTAGMFINADMVRSNYVSKVDKEKCVACGECVQNCPVNALQLGQKLCSRTPVTTEIKRTETPRDTEWGPDKWNPDYRINRKMWLILVRVLVKLNVQLTLLFRVILNLQHKKNIKRLLSLSNMKTHFQQYVDAFVHENVSLLVQEGILINQLLSMKSKIHC